MANSNGNNENEREKVTLGEERFEALPKVSEEIKKINETDEVIEVDKVIIQREPVDKGKKKGRMKFYAVLAVVIFFLALFAEPLRRTIFKGDDSLLFLPKGGLFNPQVGVVLMTLGVVIAVIAFISLFNRRGKMTLKQKWVTILLGVLLVVSGFSTFFRYVDFKENTVTDRSLLSMRSYTYLDVAEVNASTYTEGEDNRLSYTYKFQNGRTYDVSVSEDNMEAVRKIDTKIKGTAKRSIDNYAIQEMERLKMYTKEEALKLFILE